MSTMSGLVTFHSSLGVSFATYKAAKFVSLCDALLLPISFPVNVTMLTVFRDATLFIVH